MASSEQEQINLAVFVIEDFTPVPYKAPPPPKAEKPIPPYTGFGSEEDSLCSCMSLLPKPPQKDFKKFMEKDRYFGGKNNYNLLLLLL